MKIDNSALIDSNVLIYAADLESEFQENARNLLDQGMDGKVSLCVSSQVLLEFFSVVTNPRRVNNPRSPEDAIEEIKKYLSSRLTVIVPGDEITEKILDLCKRHPVKGQGIFDLQMVATMLSNGITKIYTYNVNHFRPFEEIEVLTP